MKLLLRQRIFSWFDSFDIYDEEDRTVFTVEGQLSWGHRLEIYEQTGDGLRPLYQAGDRIVSRDGAAV